MLAMLVMTLIAIAAAVAAWLRPLPETKTPSAAPPPAFTAKQTDDAKADVCDAYKLVSKSVYGNTHRTNPVPGDAIGDLATGAYEPLTAYTGGDYLLDRLAAEPATPTELANSIKSLGNTLKKIAIVDLAGESASVRNPLRDAINADFATIDKGLCK